MQTPNTFTLTSLPPHLTPQCQTTTTTVATTTMTENQENLQLQQQLQMTQQQQLQQQQQQQQHMDGGEQDQQQLQMQYQQLQMMDDFNSQNVGIHDDLAISDSDEENNLKMEITKEEPPENDNDDGGLWF